MPKARGTAFARYLRKVHVEWTAFKPKALAPVFLQELHTKTIMDATPKMTISKKLLSTPQDAAAPPAFIDRTRITFACGTEKVFDLAGLKLSDIIEEIEMENVRIQREERDRGRPF